MSTAIQLEKPDYVFIDERFDLLYQVVSLNVPFYFITNYLEYIDRTSLALMRQAEKVLFYEYEDSLPEKSYCLNNLEFIGPIYQIRKKEKLKEQCGKISENKNSISVLLGGSKSLPAKIENLRLFYFLQQLPKGYNISVYGEEYLSYLGTDERFAVKNRSLCSVPVLPCLVLHKSGLSIAS